MPVGYPNTPEDVLTRYTENEQGCWIWTGTVLNNGYGQVKLRTRKHLTHRFFYEHIVGPIPDGMYLDHLCREKRCVNPAHLEPVTPQENVVRGLASYEIRRLCHSRRHDITDPANVKIIPSTGARTCRACNAEANRRHCKARYWRRKNAALSDAAGHDSPVAATTAAVPGAP